jgi:DNA-directed RNA polymerase specialized sigma subunit
LLTIKYATGTEAIGEMNVAETDGSNLGLCSSAHQIYPNQNYNLQQIKGNVTSREKQILETFLLAGFSKEDVAKVLGISVSGAYKLLIRMSEKGLLQTRKEGRQWMYLVVK